MTAAEFRVDMSEKRGKASAVNLKFPSVLPRACRNFKFKTALES
jgi:hypothetical protein